jgi:hypothetical protein
MAAKKATVTKAKKKVIILRLLVGGALSMDGL